MSHEKDTLLIIRNRKIVGEIKGEIYIGNKNRIFGGPISGETPAEAKTPKVTIFEAQVKKDLSSAQIARIEKEENKTFLFSIKYGKVYRAWYLNYYDGNWDEDSFRGYSFLLRAFEGDENIKNFISPKKLLLYYL